MTELETLKAQATEMGIQFHANIGVEALKARIAARKAEAPAEPLSENDLIRKMREEALKLVRVIVTPMDVLKKDYPGEILSVSNSVLGTVKKLVLFNEPYHLPQILVDELREKKCQVFTSRKDNNNLIREAKLINAYGIQVLPPLTEQELEDLRKSQLARSSVGN